jgi:two-component system, NtrC family, response regulator AtoC
LEAKTVTAGARVLIVDDDAAARRLLDVRLRALGCAVTQTSDGEEALSELSRGEPDLMLLDFQMAGMDGIDVLREIRKTGVELPVIVVTAHGSIETAVEAMKQGAYDFITKPIDSQYLEIVVRKALERVRLRTEIELLTADVHKRYPLVVGKSEKMQRAVDRAKKVAASTATVLLLGESGTGKEIFARAIHNWSERRSQPFVAINCVGLSTHLLESELFGHEKGAFTGADQLKKGKIELANGGTVFLDEIGDVSQELQTKLLRFLQEREFDRVGGLRPIQVDIRIIAATNRDLAGYVRDGRFRSDLYHRLNVIPITLPPLRERKEDIPSLAQFFLSRFATEAKKNLTALSDEALEKLKNYDWPGNVRELANVIEHAVVLGHGTAIAIADMPSTLGSFDSSSKAEDFSYRSAVDNFRRALVAKVLGETRGNRAAAAKSLGLHEKSLLRLIKALRVRE